MSLELLLKHRETWNSKPLLRFIYRTWYRDITAHLTDGMSVELCGGTGNLKEYESSVISTDLTLAPWLDAVVNAEALPFPEASLSNIVLIDGLHHIAKVCTFFEEACRALRTGGRIIILEPYLSPLSFPVYHFIHEEPVDFSRNPLDNESAKKGTLPFDANQAVATILFEKDYHRFHRRFTLLEKTVHRHLLAWNYVLSGGFSHNQLIPTAVAKVLGSVKKIVPLPRRLLAFRLFVVLEKKQPAVRLSMRPDERETLQLSGQQPAFPVSRQSAATGV